VHDNMYVHACARVGVRVSGCEDAGECTTICTSARVGVRVSECEGVREQCGCVCHCMCVCRMLLVCVVCMY
jgi:hypothetical protein